MSASISLALASKISLVLGNTNDKDDRKFVSFIPPSIQYAFRYPELNFFNNTGSAEVDAITLERNRSNFATIVNQVPNDNIIFSTPDTGPLWKIFETIINSNSITARMELSEEEKKKLAEAQQFCQENYSNYRSYKNAADQCHLDYNEAKCSLDFASGEEKMKLQAEWDSFREKSLKERIQIAENDLEVLGKKAAVTEALNTIQNLETKKGIDQLKEEIQIKLGTLFPKGDASRAGTEYYYTDFSPLGSFDENSPAWSQLVLYSSEIESLCENAPPTLRDLFAGETPIDNLESISFEYAIVSVVREWFSEAFLCSGNWKFALDTDTLVSDGNVPAKGLIPAYLNKIVCIRKLSYKQKIATPEPRQFALPIISRLAVQDFNLKKRTAENPTPVTETQPAGKPQMMRVANLDGLQLHTKPAVATRAENTARLLKWRHQNIAGFKAVRTKDTSPPPPPPPEPSTIREHSFEGIKFIAFECKRLLRSPNPDPNLVWN